MAFNAFVILDVTKDSTRQELQQAYHRLALLHHPDKQGDVATFREVKAAHDVLIDDAKKQQHLRDTCPAQLGEFVRLHGLRGKPYLNGVVGTAGAWNGQRLTVTSLSCGPVAVKPANVSREGASSNNAWTRTSSSAAASATASSWRAPTASYSSADASASTGDWSTPAGTSSSAHASASSGSWSTCTPGAGARFCARATSTSTASEARGAWSWASAGTSNGTDDCAAQDGEVMKQWPGSGQKWPWCQMCCKWSDPDHRRSRKHQNALWWAKRQHCPEAEAPLRTGSPAQPKPSRPLPTNCWTESEERAVQDLLQLESTAFDMQDSSGGMYAMFAGYEAFNDWNEDELRANARILQLGLMRWRSQKVQELQRESHSKGKGCLEATIQTFDWTAQTHSIEHWYVKTAGDMLQSNWVWKRRLDSRFQFGHGACQSAFSKWICLSFCVLEDEMEWNEHGMADLCEAVTLYLPVRLANHYLTCLANYHKLKWAHLDVLRCQYAGDAPCFKVVPTGACFCRKHRSSQYE